ncbi:DUF4403 family protein [Salinimicrobium catena]|uniref:DUF4403 family protein n=1 Tax=Salinimicrobium catena TaxID=390640 RepID=UPI002FE4714E
MENIEKPQENLVLNLPVKISYKVLEAYLRKELLGEVIRDDHSKEETSEYAQILALSLRKSGKENFDLALILRIKTLTSFFKNKILRLNFHASLQFEKEKQEISVNDYSLEGENRSWLMNKFIQVLANTFMYSSLKKKMRFDFRPVIEKQLEEINQKLTSHLEVFDGIFLTGKIQDFRITEIVPGEDYLLVSVAAAGSGLVNVQELNF